MMKIRSSRSAWLLLTVALLLPPGCSDSPKKVVEELGEHAKYRRLVQFRDSFSQRAQEALQRQFREDGLDESEGWRDLMMGYLGKDREPPEVLGEEIQGESAVVKVSQTVKPPKGTKAPMQTIVQDLLLTEQDDEWKLALGPMKYEVQTEKEKKGKEKKEKPLADEDFSLEAKKAGKEKVEDIDLDEF